MVSNFPYWASLSRSSTSCLIGLKQCLHRCYITRVTSHVYITFPWLITDADYRCCPQISDYLDLQWLLALQTPSRVPSLLLNKSTSEKKRILQCTKINLYLVDRPCRPPLNSLIACSKHRRISS
ncbi:unnamed protein product [Chondrus crispus]|uniref:Uncharacterized protein n=1 Tax=Chondrus crispus TaxID=2769 RepID=R7QKZ0_CHOCR|nr:unnamed protein product [Chondrus crispus]CDF38749.1 unnamed protein product [Chondrus crispus]|eukprot:XP_005718654.1 unnamed protein product [Chondrus crispus]